MKKPLLFILIGITILIAGTFIAQAITIEIPNPLKYDKITDIIDAIITGLMAIAIPLGSVLIIIGGIQYLTSAGNEEKIRKAKNTLLYTVIGVAIVLAAKFIIELIQEILGGI